MKEMIEWLVGWPLQVFGTLTFTYPRVNDEIARRMLLIWCRENAKRDGVRVGCKGILNHERHPHIHLLVLARSGKTERTFADLNPKNWERQWPAKAELSFIEDSTKPAIIYTFVKNTRGSHYQLSYGENLLKNIGL